MPVDNYEEARICGEEVDNRVRVHMSVDDYKNGVHFNMSFNITPDSNFKDVMDLMVEMRDKLEDPKDKEVS